MSKNDGDYRHWKQYWLLWFRSTLNFSDICRMVGIPEHEIDPYSEEDTHFVINEEFVAALRDKELRKSMIERLFSTIH